MPIYEYQCEECGHVFDKFVRTMSAASDVECPACHAKECRKNVTAFGALGLGASTGVSAAANCAPRGG